MCSTRRARAGGRRRIPAPIGTRPDTTGASPQRGDRLAPSADDEGRGAAAGRQHGPRGLCQRREERRQRAAAAAAAGGDLKIGLAYDTGGRGDKSFNDSAFAGVEAAIKEHGGKVSELSPNADASNRADLLTQLADQGYNPIIAVGFAYGDVIGDGGRAVPGHHLRDRRLVGAPTTGLNNLHRPALRRGARAPSSPASPRR